MIRQILLSSSLLAVLLSTSIQAAPETKKPAEKSAPSANTSIDTFETDVVATRENPSQSNIISWQNQGTLPLDTQIEFSVLKDSLTPTDRDRLSTEIQYSQRLNKPEQ